MKHEEIASVELIPAFYKENEPRDGEEVVEKGTEEWGDALKAITGLANGVVNSIVEASIEGIFKTDKGFRVVWTPESQNKMASEGVMEVEFHRPEDEGNFGADEPLEGETLLERYSREWVNNLMAVVNDPGPSAKTVLAAAISNIYVSEPEEVQTQDHRVQAVRVVWKPEVQRLLALESIVRKEALSNTGESDDA